jgi:hypothetical protein
MEDRMIYRLRRFLLVIVVGIGLPLSQTYAQSEHADITVGPLVGDKAPDIKIKTLDEEEFQLEQWIGKKPFVMVFFVTWCTRCKGEIPTIKKIYH